MRLIKQYLEEEQKTPSARASKVWMTTPVRVVMRVALSSRPTEDMRVKANLKDQ